MKCYNCGCRLSEKSFCTACGADVSKYKKIMYASNRFYNEGLEKAGVRNLSGAVDSLRQSLKLNKNNIEARNLLGLVYYEMGEAVSALGEWVISKNLRTDKNIADDYINMIQTNPSRLDTINQTIKKYNQALTYCKQGSLDLAIIQLKKVLSLNGNYVSAHQLLALLYIETQEWDKAKRELRRCQKIDKNNTTTMRFLKEIEENQVDDEGAKISSKKRSKISEDVIKYQSGNETIIQPINTKESKGASTLLNIGIGLIIGLAGAYFLLMPGRVQSAISDVQNELRTVSDQMDAKTATIEELEQQVSNLKETNESLQTNLDTYVGTDGTMKAVDYLMQASNLYLTNPEDLDSITAALDAMGNVDEIEGKTEAFQNLYTKLLEEIGPSVAKKYYDTGFDQYKKELYDEAVVNLNKAFEYDPTNGDALLYLGHCYRNLEINDKATETYQKVVDLFPGTEKSKRAKNFMEEMKA